MISCRRACIEILSSHIMRPNITREMNWLVYAYENIIFQNLRLQTYLLIHCSIQLCFDKDYEVSSVIKNTASIRHMVPPNNHQVKHYLLMAILICSVFTVCWSQTLEVVLPSTSLPSYSSPLPSIDHVGSISGSSPLVEHATGAHLDADASRSDIDM